MKAPRPWAGPGVGVRGRLLTLLVAAIALPPLAQADWLQSGGDAAQHGSIPGDGPRLNETAFALKVAAARPHRAGPLILGRSAYVIANTNTGGPPSLLSVDLDTARVETRRALDGGAQSLAANDQGFLVLGSNGLDVIPFAATAEPTRISPPSTMAPGAAMDCAEPLPDGAVVYTACIVHHASTLLGDGPDAPQLVIERLNLTRRARDWTHTHQLPGAAQPAHVGSASYVVGMAADRGHLYVTTQETTGTSGALQAYVYALRSGDGTVHWQLNSRRDVNHRQPENLTASSIWNFATPLAAEGLVFVKFHDLQFIDPATGTAVWRDSLRMGDPKAYDRGSGMAYRDGILYAAAHRTISAYDVKERNLLWRIGQERFGPGEELHTGGLIVAGNFLYARASRLETPPDETDTHVRHDSVYGFRLRGREEPELAWTRRLVPRNDFHEPTGQVPAFRLAAEQGILVAQGVDGTLTVVGRTEASIQPAVPSGPLNPAPGAEVRLDLSPTRQGALGDGPEDLEFAVRWGDEPAPTDLAWSKDPVLRHRYALAADFQALVYVRNSAGQLSIVPLTFEVGRPSPPHLNFLQRAFSNENQDRTFFLLGLIITGSGSFLGVARLQRRRGLLHRELRAIEDAYLMHNHLPMECEAALGERKTRLRGLLLDNRITETQYAVLERRVEELRAAVRLNSLEDHFDFMPVALMKRLQRILSDGHITGSEYHEFLASLRRERSMSAAEKRKVKALVERWFARDSAAV